MTLDWGRFLIWLGAGTSLLGGLQLLATRLSTGRLTKSDEKYWLVLMAQVMVWGGGVMFGIGLLKLML